MAFLTASYSDDFSGYSTFGWPWTVIADYPEYAPTVDATIYQRRAQGADGVFYYGPPGPPKPPNSIVFCWHRRQSPVYYDEKARYFDSAYLGHTRNVEQDNNEVTWAGVTWWGDGFRSCYALVSRWFHDGNFLPWQLRQYTNGEYTVLAQGSGAWDTVAGAYVYFTVSGDVETVYANTTSGPSFTLSREKSLDAARFGFLFHNEYVGGDQYGAGEYTVGPWPVPAAPKKTGCSGFISSFVHSGAVEFTSGDDTVFLTADSGISTHPTVHYHADSLPGISETDGVLDLSQYLCTNLGNGNLLVGSNAPYQSSCSSRSSSSSSLSSASSSLLSSSSSSLQSSWQSSLSSSLSSLSSDSSSSDSSDLSSRSSLSSSLSSDSSSLSSSNESSSSSVSSSVASSGGSSSSSLESSSSSLASSGGSSSSSLLSSSSSLLSSASSSALSSSSLSLSSSSSSSLASFSSSSLSSLSSDRSSSSASSSAGSSSSSSLSSESSSVSSSRSSASSWASSSASSMSSEFSSHSSASEISSSSLSSSRSSYSSSVSSLRSSGLSSDYSSSSSMISSILSSLSSLSSSSESSLPSQSSSSSSLLSDSSSGLSSSSSEQSSSSSSLLSESSDRSSSSSSLLSSQSSSNESSLSSSNSSLSSSRSSSESSFSSEQSSALSSWSSSAASSSSSKSSSRLSSSSAISSSSSSSISSSSSNSARSSSSSALSSSSSALSSSSSNISNSSSSSLLSSSSSLYSSSASSLSSSSLNSCQNCDPPIPLEFGIYLDGLAGDFADYNGANHVTWTSGCTWSDDTGHLTLLRDDSGNRWAVKIYFGSGCYIKWWGSSYLADCDPTDDVYGTPEGGASADCGDPNSFANSGSATCQVTTWGAAQSSGSSNYSSSSSGLSSSSSGLSSSSSLLSSGKSSSSSGASSSSSSSAASSSQSSESSSGMSSSSSASSSANSSSSSSLLSSSSSDLSSGSSSNCSSAASSLRSSESSLASSSADTGAWSSAVSSFKSSSESYVSSCGAGETGLSDNFNRDNETPLASPWNLVNRNGTNQINLVSNAIKIAGGAGDQNCCAWHDTALSSGNHYSQVDMVSANGVGGGGPVTRHDGTANKNWYELQQEAWSSWQLTLNKIVNGAYTNLSVRAGGAAATLKLESSGSDHSYYYNGALKDTVSDSSHDTTKKYVGIQMIAGGDAAYYGIADNWSADIL